MNLKLNTADISLSSHDLGLISIFPEDFTYSINSLRPIKSIEVKLDGEHYINISTEHILLDSYHTFCIDEEDFNNIILGNHSLVFEIIVDDILILSECTFTKVH